MPEDKKKRLSSDNDSQLFREFIGEVNILSNTERHFYDDTSKPKPIKKSFPPLKADYEYIVDHTNDITSEQYVFFAHSSVQAKTIKKLKRGAITINETIDLHGLDKQQAQHYIRECIREQLELQQRYLLLIHGKGTRSLNQSPVLKNLCVNLLKNDSAVLAFASAQPKDGGTGALYVLLRQKR